VAVVRGLAHAGIIRLVGLRAGRRGIAALAAIEVYAEELAEGAIATVEPGRVRVRPGSRSAE